MTLLLYLSVFVIATCGLVYELIAGTAASYFLGDSVTQFSTVIGAYLSAMGVGSYASRYVKRHLIGVFVQVELLVALIGGCSAAVLFLAYAHVSAFRVVLYGVVGVVGLLVGLEIPLLMRLLKDRLQFEELVARVLTFDYIGALAASLLFPLVLAPQLGLLRSAFLFGLMNLAVAVGVLYAFRRDNPWFAAQTLLSVLTLGLLVAGFAASDGLVSWAETQTYADPVVLARSTPYQRIVLTQRRDDLRLYLNGNLQFSARDEYRYHEALVHPAMAAVAAPRNVLVLGGGDGLAVREILRYPAVRRIVLVDLDAEVTRLFAEHPALTRLNAAALTNVKVHVANADAFRWLAANQELFDCIIVDFPDPSNYSVGKLYTDRFYRLMAKALAPGGVAVVQSTSPYVARRSFWCVARTLEAAGWQTTPYHAYVPSFGEWGYVLATRGPYRAPTAFPPGLRFLTPEDFADMRRFPPDMAPLPVEVNRLNNQNLVHIFEAEWAAYGQ